MIWSIVFFNKTLMIFSIINKFLPREVKNRTYNYQLQSNPDSQPPSFYRSKLFAGVLLASGLSLGAALAPSGAKAAYAFYDVKHRLSVNVSDLLCSANPNTCASRALVKGLFTYANANSFATSSWPLEIDGPNSITSTEGPITCPTNASCYSSRYVQSLSQVTQAIGQSTAFAEAEYVNLSPGSGRATAVTHVTGSARAVGGDKRYAYARASSTALAKVLQGTRVGGRIFWRPIITSISTGKTSAVQWRDPLSYVIEDGVMTTHSGDLLKINYETSTLNDNPVVFDLPDNATPLTLHFPVNGLFSIDMTDHFVTNPGFLKLQATNGLWTTLEKSGIYNVLTLPTLGSAATWTVALSDLFNPGGICGAGYDPFDGFCLDPNWSALSATSEVTLNADGFGFAEAEVVPGPLPLLGVGAALGYSRVLRRRIKSVQSLAENPARD
jgi:hypothetical protein